MSAGKLQDMAKAMQSLPQSGTQSTEELSRIAEYAATALEELPQSWRAGVSKTFPLGCNAVLRVHRFLWGFMVLYVTKTTDKTHLLIVCLPLQAPGLSGKSHYFSTPLWSVQSFLKFLQ